VIGDFNSAQIDLYDSLLDNFITKTFSSFHTLGIIFAKYFPANDYVASSSYDATVNVWNPNTGESILKYKGHSQTVYGFDQIDENTLVSGSYDKTFHIWEISTGKTLHKTNVGSSIYSIRSLSNKLIACGLSNTLDNLRIYNYSTLVKTLYGHSAVVESIELLSEHLLVSGSKDTKLIVWDLSSYSIKYNLTAHTVHVYCVKRLSSSLMASGDTSGQIIIWNWLNGSLVHTLTGHTFSLRRSSLDLYNDDTLISGSWDKTVKFWNITNGQLLQTIQTNIQIGAIVMLKKGKLKYYS